MADPLLLPRPNTRLTTAYRTVWASLTVNAHAAFRRAGAARANMARIGNVRR